MQRRTAKRVASILLATALVSGCAASSTSTTATEPNETESAAAGATTAPTQAPEPTAEPAPEPTAAPEPTVAPEPTPEPTAAPEPTPAPEPAPTQTTFWASELEVGDCINRLPGNPAFEPPDIVSCNELHDEEFYALDVLDAPLGDPYPGDDALVDLAAQQICDEATIAFAGESWDQLPLVTYVTYPIAEEWEAGDRNIGCSAAAIQEGMQKIGTAAGGTLESTDILLARAALALDGDEFVDWVLVRERDTTETTSSITDGGYELPPRRPTVLPGGFFFGGSRDGTPSSYAYDWISGSLTDLGTPLEGFEVATVLLAADNAIVSARANNDSDWDLYAIDSAENVTVLVGGEGDQLYPTLTPDLTEVVYHDNGDLWIINADGTNPRQLTSGPANDWESAVSPDGNTIVFASDRSGNDDIWAITVESPEPVNLTNHPAHETWPTFSEDGSIIYFATDRLGPQDGIKRLMMMEADGSNASWFADVSASHPAVLTDRNDDIDRALAELPTLSERYNYDTIAGDIGTTTEWVHSSGRLLAELPAGWRVSEFDEGIGFVAAPRPEYYFDTWITDGVVAVLYDDLAEDIFFEQFFLTDAVSSCEQFDGSDGIIELEDGRLAITANHTCVEGTVAGVIAFYDPATSSGIVIEGQRDNYPDEETDKAILDALAASLSWG